MAKTPEFLYVNRYVYIIKNVMHRGDVCEYVDWSFSFFFSVNPVNAHICM